MIAKILRKKAIHNFYTLKTIKNKLILILSILPALLCMELEDSKKSQEVVIDIESRSKFYKNNSFRSNKVSSNLVHAETRLQYAVDNHNQISQYESLILSQLNEALELPGI